MADHGDRGEGPSAGDGSAGGSAPGGGSNSGGGSNDGGGGNGEGGGIQGGGDDQSPSTAETVVMVVSALFTLVFFSFALWQAVAAPPGGTPRVRVTDTRTTASGDVVVIVELRNTQEVGLSRATVEAECTTPPTDLTFEHVPAGGRRTGRMVCPPGTEDPKVSLASWIER